MRIKDQYQWEGIAIGVSLLLHVAVFKALVLLFPVGPVAYKPPLTFLGSILDRENLMVQIPSSSEDWSFSAVSAYPQQGEFYPLKSTEVTKPSFHPLQDSKKGKAVLKSTFAEEEVPSVEEVDTQSLGIDPHVPAYVPLRSYLR